MIKVKIKHNKNGDCSEHCALLNYDDNWYPFCALGLKRLTNCTDYTPGPDCPGPGTYELRKVVGDE